MFGFGCIRRSVNFHFGQKYTKLFVPTFCNLYPLSDRVTLGECKVALASVFIFVMFFRRIDIMKLLLFY